LVFWALNRACPDAVPPEILGKLRAGFKQSTKQNLILSAELHRLLDLFRQADLPVIPLKGPVLAWPFYEAPGLRAMSDLDLLVPECEASRAIHLLSADGYRRFGPSIGLRFFLDGGQLVLKSADGRFDIDLHWRVLPAHFNPLDAAAIRARCASIDVAGRPTPAFCPEDLLAFLCVHGAKHGWDSLAGICDLARLIDVCKLDWDVILSRAARLRMSRIVWLGLCLAQDLLGSKLPPEVSSRIRADAHAAALAASIRARLQDGREWSSRDLLIFRFRLLEGAWRKFRFLWYIVQPTPVEWEILNLPESLAAVYSLARPIRLAWKWCVRPMLRLKRTNGPAGAPQLPEKLPGRVM